MTAPLLRGGKTLYALCRWHRRRARPAALEASYSFDDASVRFTIFPHGAEGTKGPWETATISEQALRDAFGARGGVRSLLEAFDEGASLINAKALACLRDHPGQAVFLTSADFASVRGGDEVVDALAAETVR